jgi:hypothetical protein
MEMVNPQEIAASLARHFGTGKIVGGLTLEEAALDALHIIQVAERGSRPVIVCLCGSTRFYEAFQRANYDETMAGRIVLSVGFYPHSSEQAHGETIGITPEQKRALDELHLRKIDLADEVLILNVGGYIGESTARELAYARRHGKNVRFLEPEAR